MENTTSLTPFRSAPPALLPIEEKLVPDCGLRELEQLAKKINSLNDKRRILFCESDCEVSSIIFWAIMATIVISGVGILILNPAWYISVPLIGLIACMSGFIFSKIFNKGAQLKYEEFAPQIQISIEKLSAKLKKLQSLAKLTGKIETASKLQDRVLDFNRSLEDIEELNCSSSDIKLIQCERQNLLREINSFRLHVGEEQD